MGTPFGFPDWQNQRPLDGPLLLDLNASHSTTNNTLAAQYVGRWARIAGDAFIATQPCVWTFTWYTDQAATKQLGQRKLVTHQSIGVPLKFMLPNLGPWVTVGYSVATPALGIDITHHLYGTNREPPLEITPVGPLLAHQWPINIPAGASQTVWCSDYADGPAWIVFEPIAVGRLRVQTVVDNAGNTRNVYDVTLAANAVDQRELWLPPTACNLLITNTSGAAADYFATLTPSYTGA